LNSINQKEERLYAWSSFEVWSGVNEDSTLLGCDAAEFLMDIKTLQMNATCSFKILVATQ